jgi:hypothetical protein
MRACAEAETRATVTLQARIAAEEALAAKAAEAAAAAQTAVEAKQVRLAHEQELKRMRVGSGRRAWPWVAALLVAGVLVGFLWYDKPIRTRPAAAVSGEPLKLKLARELRQ